MYSDAARDQCIGPRASHWGLATRDSRPCFTKMTPESTLHWQLEAVRKNFAAAQDRLRALAQSVPEADWTRRPDPVRWSIAECVSHLNLTGEAYLPLLHAALQHGRELGGPAPERYRRDLIGWLMWCLAGPPVRYRVKTKPAFVPTAIMPRPQLLSEFDRLQAAQVSCVVEANGMRLGQLWIRSPFDPRIHYNMYSCLTILPRHQHRHLWQAEQVWASIAH
jgi:hypothetical protein